MCKNISSLHVLLHGPLYATGIALPRKHAACLRSHMLGYVRPSEPQIDLSREAILADANSSLSINVLFMWMLLVQAWLLFPPHFLCVQFTQWGIIFWSRRHRFFDGQFNLEQDTVWNETENIISASEISVLVNKTKDYVCTARSRQSSGRLYADKNVLGVYRLTCRCVHLSHKQALCDEPSLSGIWMQHNWAHRHILELHFALRISVSQGIWPHRMFLEKTTAERSMNK